MVAVTGTGGGTNQGTAGGLTSPGSNNPKPVQVLPVKKGSTTTEEGQASPGSSARSPLSLASSTLISSPAHATGNLLTSAQLNNPLAFVQSLLATSPAPPAYSGPQAVNPQAPNYVSPGSAAYGAYTGGTTAIGTPTAQSAANANPLNQATLVSNPAAQPYNTVYTSPSGANTYYNASIAGQTGIKGGLVSSPPVQPVIRPVDTSTGILANAPTTAPVQPVIRPVDTSTVAPAAYYAALDALNQGARDQGRSTGALLNQLSAAQIEGIANKTLIPSYQTNADGTQSLILTQSTAHATGNLLTSAQLNNPLAFVQSLLATSPTAQGGTLAGTPPQPTQGVLQNRSITVGGQSVDAGAFGQQTYGGTKIIIPIIYDPLTSAPIGFSSSTNPTDQYQTTINGQLYTFVYDSGTGQIYGGQGAFLPPNATVIQGVNYQNYNAQQGSAAYAVPNLSYLNAPVDLIHSGGYQSTSSSSGLGAGPAVASAPISLAFVQSQGQVSSQGNNKQTLPLSSQLKELSPEILTYLFALDKSNAGQIFSNFGKGLINPIVNQAGLGVNALSELYTGKPYGYNYGANPNLLTPDLIKYLNSKPEYAQYLSNAGKPTTSTQTLLSKQLYGLPSPTGPNTEKLATVAGEIGAFALGAGPTIIPEVVSYLITPTIIASITRNIETGVAINILGTTISSILQGKGIPTAFQLGSATTTGAEGGAFTGAITPLVNLPSSIPAFNKLAEIAPTILKAGITNIPNVINSAIDFGNLLATLDYTNATGQGRIPSAQELLNNWTQGAIYGTIFGVFAPVVQYAPEGVAREVANILSGAGGSVLGTNLLSLLGTGALSSASQDAVAGVVGAAFTGGTKLLSGAPDVIGKLSPFDVEKSSYQKNPFTEGTSSYKLIAKVPDIVQDVSNIFLNRDISSTNLESLYNDLQNKNNGIKPTTNQIIEAITDNPDLLDEHNLPTNPFRYQKTLISITLGPRLIPGADTFDGTLNSLSLLNRVLTKAISDQGGATGGSLSLQAGLPTSAFTRTPGDADGEFNVKNKALLDKTKAIQTTVQNYYQESGADPKRIGVQEGKGIGKGTQYHITDTDPTTGIVTKLADINYQESIPKTVIIDGIKFVDYRDTLRDKLSIIKNGARPEVVEKAISDIADIQKAQKDYGVGVPTKSSPLGISIDIGNPKVPSSYYVPERNIQAILTNRPIPDSIFKNPSDVATFQKALDKEGADKPNNLEAGVLRKYTDLFYSLKNSNLAPLKYLNIDIEGHPLESQAMQEVLTRPANKGKVLIEGSNVGSIAFRDFRGSGDVDTVAIGKNPSTEAERIVKEIVDKTNELYGREVYKFVAEKDGSFTAQRINKADSEALDHITTMKPKGQTTASAEDKEYNEEFRNPLGTKETNRYLEAQGVKALQPSELEGRKIATSIAPRQFTEAGLPKEIKPSIQKTIDYLRTNVGEGGTFVGSLGRGTDTGDKLFPNKDVGDSLVLAKSISDRYYGGQLNDLILSIAKDQVTRGFITQEGYDALATKPITELEDRQGITTDTLNGFNEAIKENVATPQEVQVTTPTSTTAPISSPQEVQVTTPTSTTAPISSPQEVQVTTPTSTTAPISSPQEVQVTTPTSTTAPISSPSFASATAAPLTASTPAIASPPIIPDPINEPYFTQLASEALSGQITQSQLSALESAGSISPYTYNLLSSYLPSTIPSSLEGSQPVYASASPASPAYASPGYASPAFGSPNLSPSYTYPSLDPSLLPYLYPSPSELPSPGSSFSYSTGYLPPGSTYGYTEGPPPPLPLPLAQRIGQYKRRKLPVPQGATTQYAQSLLAYLFPEISQEYAIPAPETIGRGLLPRPALTPENVAEYQRRTAIA